MTQAYYSDGENFMPLYNVSLANDIFTANTATGDLIIGKIKNLFVEYIPVKEVQK